jgi:hypothetical protein
MNLAEMFSQGESETVEFKASFSDEALEMIGALANVAGGVLIITGFCPILVRRALLAAEDFPNWRSPRVTSNVMRRTYRRSPMAFLFQLLAEEATRLRFQIGTPKRRRGGRRYAPYAFTEQGVAMLSGVLRSREDDVLE